MGMSTHIIGFKPPDKEWEKMKAVWDACIAAKVPVPEEVSNFFNHEAPDPSGVEVELEGTASVSEFNEEGRRGFEVEVKRLPSDVKIIRFYNAW